MSLKLFSYQKAQVLAGFFYSICLLYPPDHVYFWLCGSTDTDLFPVHVLTVLQAIILLL